MINKILVYIRFYFKKMINQLSDLIKRIRFPYRELQKEGIKKEKENPKEAERVSKKKKLDKQLADKNVITIVENENLMGVVLDNVNKPIDIDKVKKELCASKVNDIGMFFHNKKYHQLAIPFATNSAFRYNYRSDSMRKRLKPLLYPMSSKPFDRTHVIPIGYHGSENDNRLVVGWDSEQNRNEMVEFEKKVSSINKNQRIIWFASIELNEDSTATWTAKILDNKGSILLEETFDYKCPFKWK